MRMGVLGIATAAPDTNVDAADITALDFKQRRERGFAVRNRFLLLCTGAFPVHVIYRIYRELSSMTVLLTP